MYAFAVLAIVEWDLCEAVVLAGGHQTKTILDAIAVDPVTSSATQAILFIGSVQFQLTGGNEWLHERLCI